MRRHRTEPDESIIDVRLRYSIGFCLLLTVLMLGVLVWESHRQREIDANLVRVTGTLVAYDGEWYTVEYLYGDRVGTARVEDLPDNPPIGGAVCLELNGLKREHARACGTRGPLKYMVWGLVVVGWCLSLLGMIMATRWWPRHRRTVAERLARRIADDICRQIADGEIRVGSVLPSASAMARTRDVAEATIDATYDVLRERGMLGPTGSESEFVVRYRTP